MTGNSKRCAGLCSNIFATKSKIWILPACCLLLALCFGAGWVFHISSLVQVVPEWAPMQFNTAICFAVLSLSALFLNCGRSALSAVCAALVFAFAAAITSQYPLDYISGIDTLFIEPFTIVKTSHPGRMGPNTGICIMLTAAALLISSKPRARWVSLAGCGAAALSFALSASAIIGYLFSLESIYGWGDYTRMALHTAVVSSILAVYTLLRFSDVIVSSRVARLSWLSLSIFAIGFGISILTWSGVQSQVGEGIRAKIARDGDLRRELLQHQLDSEVNLLRSVERFFASSDYVSESEYADFVGPLFVSSSALAVDWTPQIQAAERGAFEAALGRQISAATKDKVLTRRNEASTYFPVMYTASLPTAVDPLGFDHASDEARAEAIASLLSGERDTSVAKVQLFRFRGGPGGEFVVFLFAPRGSSLVDKNRHVPGLVVGLFSAANFVKRAFQGLSSDNMQMEFALPSGAGGYQSFYRYSPTGGAWVAEESRARFEYLGRLNVAGQEWRLKISPSPAYLLNESSSLPHFILIGMLLLSVLAAGYAQTVQAHRAELTATVTSRTNALSQVREREEWFKQLAATAPIGIFRTDVRGNCEYVNPEWSALAGLNPEEARGDGWVRALHPDDVERVAKEWGSAVEKGEPFSSVFRFKNTSGSTWIASNAAPVSDENQNVRGYVGTCANVTELYEARERMREAAESKARFLANMSHEIRTPLTGILGFSESLVGSSATQQEREEAALLVNQSASHLLEIVNDILDFSKIESGKFEVSKKRTELFSIVQFVERSFKNRAAENRTALRVDYQFPLPAVIETDALRLRQILMNLVSNAIKFTTGGEVVIRVVYSPDQKSLHFIVKDSGIGMNANQLSKLFEVFSQVDSSSSRRHGGTGLGLAISRRLARMLGGDISVESAAGQGSTFELKIDAGDQSRDDLCHTVPVSTVSAKPQYQRVEGRVLIAEDGLVNQKLLRRILEKAGAKVSVANNGQEAMECLEKEEFDLVLMDMQMPILDGYTATRLLRERGLAIPIVACTADASEDNRERCRTLGCNDVLYKPFHSEGLQTLLAQFLKSA